ncbi:hypothetical protein [Azospirillum argentinense]
MKKFTALFFACTALVACQNTWNYKGKSYTSTNEVVGVMVADQDAYTSQIKPLNRPVTDKNLVVVVPSRTYFMENHLRVLREGTPNLTMAAIDANPGFATGYSEYINLPKWIETKKIYPAIEVKVVDVPTSILPADQSDVLIMTLTPKLGARDQWYFHSAKNGKRAIQGDNGVVELFDRWDSMLDAVKTAAMQ